MADRVGFIGLGIMGKPMARNLLDAGFALTVHSRGPAPVDELVEAGRRAGGVAGRGRRGVRRRRSRCCPTRPTSSWSCSGTAGCVDGAAAGLARHRHEHDRPGRDADDRRRGWPRRGVAMLDAPVSGGEKGAIDGDAVDHGRRDARGVRRARRRCSTRWARTSCTSVRAAPARSPRRATSSSSRRRSRRSPRRSLLARARGRRCGEGPRGAARRVRRLEDPRGARPADARPRLRARVPRAAAPQGRAHRARGRAARSARRCRRSRSSPEQLDGLIEAGDGELDHSALFVELERRASG